MKNLIKIVAAFAGLLALLFQFNVLQPQEEAMACSGGGSSCSGTQVSTTCYDAENWSSGSGTFYERVCDNTKCARAWFDQYDPGTSTCTYCNN